MLHKLVVCRDYQQAKDYLHKLQDESNLNWEVTYRYMQAKHGDNIIQCVVFTSGEDVQRICGLSFNSIEFLTIPLASLPDQSPMNVVVYIMSRLRSIHTWL